MRAAGGWFPAVLLFSGWRLEGGLGGLSEPVWVCRRFMAIRAARRGFLPVGFEAVDYLSAQKVRRLRLPSCPRCGRPQLFSDFCSGHWSGG